MTSTLEIISVHFPKAAGSSLTENLRAHFGSSLALDYSHDPVNANHSLSEPPALPIGTRAVHGHFRADRYREHRKAYRLTFLREPVSNLISIYFFWRSWPSVGNSTHDKFLAERPSIVTFAREYSRIRHLMSASYFSGVDLGAFDFVGFYESRERDLGRLSCDLGIRFSSDLRVNGTSDAEAAERQALLEDTSTLCTLKSLLADDVAFYESARTRWDS
jgi:hypothetical protein